MDSKWLHSTTIRQAHFPTRWCCQRFDENDIDVDRVDAMNKSSES